MRSSQRAAICLVSLVSVAGVGWFGCNSLPGSLEAAHNSKNPGATPLHLESFVVNLADPEGGRFLRLGIDLSVDSASSNPAEVPTARIRDTILAVLTTWRSDALLAPDGKQKLKEELTRALREKVPDLNVRDVYFTDFLVQR